MKKFGKSAVALVLIMGLLSSLVPTMAMANISSDESNIVRYIPAGEEEAHTIHWLKGIKPPVMPGELGNRDAEKLGKFTLDTSTPGYAYYVSPYVAGNGWYDLNKVDPSGGADAHLCFAMAASNMLYWWMEQNEAHIDKYQEEKPGENANAIEAYQNEINNRAILQNPKESLLYKNVVLKNYKDSLEGGMPDLPIDYFLNGYKGERVAGRNIPSRFPDNNQPAEGGGLFYDVFGKSILSDRVEWQPYQYYNDHLKAFMAQGIGLMIGYSVMGNGYHAVSVWGAEYDENDQLCALYLTDNNDNEETIATDNNALIGMRRYGAYEHNGELKISTLEHPNGAGSAVHASYLLTLAEDGWKAYEATGKPMHGNGEAFLSPILKVEHVITLDAQGGEVTPTKLNTVNGGEIPELPIPTREGYKFLGWFNNAGNEVKRGNAMTVDDTFYAHWKPLEATSGEYWISFEANGGSVYPASQETNNKQLASLPVPTREGYDFAGWYTAATGGTKIEDNHTFSAATTLYAHWTPKTITLSFDSNGGSSVEAITGKYGEAVTAPADPTRVGYTFTGWEPTRPNTFPAKDASYTAKWQKNEETPGGGSGIIIPGPGGIIIPPIPGDKETVEHPDGSTTKTESRPDGSKLETTTFPNGGSVEKATDKDGQVVTTAKPAKSGEKTKVTIPEKDLNPGHVAVIVHPDGREEIVRQSVAGENGMKLVVDQEVQVKIVDNSKSFADTEKHWAKDAVEFVTAHELFNGVSATAFAPDQDMSRGMLVKVLHNLENNPAAGADGAFADVSEGQWYSDAVSWAASKGIVSGYSDGRFGPTDAVSREQLVSMLYRYAGSPAVKDVSLDFKDADKISSWSANAMAWAVENGIVHGMGDGMLAPQAVASRAQLATIMEQFCEVVL